MNCAFFNGMLGWFVAISLLAPAALMWWLVMRDWYLEWGSSDLEVLAAMAGDELVPAPTYQATLAVTVSGEPVDVWPWLVQMGYRRGGLYSYDWLDRLFGYLDGSSAEEILPEFQNLKAGDMIPLGRGPAFPVARVDPPNALVLGGAAGEFKWAWQFEVQPHGRNRTRLISRSRARVPQTFAWALFMWLLEPAAFLMTRKMLLGIKRRAEALARRRTDQVRHAA